MNRAGNGSLVKHAAANKVQAHVHKDDDQLHHRRLTLRHHLLVKVGHGFNAALSCNVGLVVRYLLVVRNKVLQANATVLVLQAHHAYAGAVPARGQTVG